MELNKFICLNIILELGYIDVHKQQALVTIEL